MSRATGAERAIYRILDANFDRAREGLRVLEDVARFALDDADLTAQLKAIRHAVTIRDQAFNLRLLDAREAGSDVGAVLNPPSELQREDLAALVLANAKRLQEALRTLEETAKAAPPPAQARLDPTALKEARFLAYQAERSLAGRLARQARRDRIRDLYVILDPEICGGREPLSVARAAIAGGARVLQLRDKVHDKGALLALARDLQALCAAADVLFIVNDHVDVALAADAGGVHVGQQDLPVAVARAQLPIDRIVGCSTNNPDEAARAVAAGADYLGVGAMFATGSKINTRPAGPERLPLVRAVVAIPIVAIGGISQANVAEVVRAGADAVAVISAVGAAPDPEEAARRLTETIQAARPASLGPASPEADRGV